MRVCNRRRQSGRNGTIPTKATFRTEAELRPVGRNETQASAPGGQALALTFSQARICLEASVLYIEAFPGDDFQLTGREGPPYNTFRCADVCLGQVLIRSRAPQGRFVPVDFFCCPGSAAGV